MTFFFLTLFIYFMQLSLIKYVYFCYNFYRQVKIISVYQAHSMLKRHKLTEPMHERQGKSFLAYFFKSFYSSLYQYVYCIAHSQYNRL